VHVIAATLPKFLLSDCVGLGFASAQPFASSPETVQPAVGPVG
jgi:hypothetical protein